MSVSSRGKWNSGRNISVGAASVAADEHCSASVKVALRRSKPNELMVPTVAIGLGRTYASAARKPGLLVSSSGVLEGCVEMEGVDKA